MESWLSEINKTVLSGGAIGALLSLLFADKELGWKGQLSTFFGGLAIAHYGTPWVVEYFTLNVRHEGGVGFLLGMLGMLVVSSLVRAIKEMDLWPIIRRRLGGE